MSKPTKIVEVKREIVVSLMGQGANTLQSSFCPTEEMAGAAVRTFKLWVKDAQKRSPAAMTVAATENGKAVDPEKLLRAYIKSNWRSK